MNSSMTRRDFIKASIAAATVSSLGLPMPEELRALVDLETGWRWDKGACRFCGVGCGIQIATDNDKMVAVKGDPDCEVNRGLLCAKGYANAKILYGADRLTRPMMRLKNGKFDKQGDFVEVTWEQAFDEMERQFKRIYKELGPTSVGIMGSGQYTVQEGYTAVKLIKAGWRSNNIDPNARHCMASAVAAFIQTFGIDEPSGCYDDIELTDTTVLWGANMAEMHPMLWARIIDKRMKSQDYRIVNLTTYSNRSSELSDLELVFKPNTDLAILNYILREIVHRDAVDHEFVQNHCVFATGPYDIGYGMRGSDEFAMDAEKDTQARQREVELTREERPVVPLVRIPAEEAFRADLGARRLCLDGVPRTAQCVEENRSHMQTVIDPRAEVPALGGVLVDHGHHLLEALVIRLPLQVQRFRGLVLRPEELPERSETGGGEADVTPVDPLPEVQQVRFIAERTEERQGSLHRCGETFQAFLCVLSVLRGCQAWLADQVTQAAASIGVLPPDVGRHAHVPGRKIVRGTLAEGLVECAGEVVRLVHVAHAVAV